MSDLYNPENIIGKATVEDCGNGIKVTVEIDENRMPYKQPTVACEPEEAAGNIEDCKVNDEEDSNLVSWAKKEIEIACKLERAESGVDDGEWDYGCSCYDSAMKAYKSLLGDEHSGFSISMTKHILNRLIDFKPLTPIEDTPDIWNDIIDRDDSRQYTCYQCTRMSSLFKYVYDFGMIRYKDVSNNVFVNIKDGSEWHSGTIQSIANELYPITMPYFPKDKPVKFYGEEFLFDKRNGDYDTVGVLYIIEPNGKRVDFKRYFKETALGFEQINRIEYLFRKVWSKWILKK